MENSKERDEMNRITMTLQVDHLLLEALKENDGTYPNDIYYVFTVQEEVGCRGSKPTAERIRPDIGIAVDITPANDYPCDLEGSNTVGKGVEIKYADP